MSMSLEEKVRAMEVRLAAMRASELEKLIFDHHSSEVESLLDQIRKLKSEKDRLAHELAEEKKKRDYVLTQPLDAVREENLRLKRCIGGQGERGDPWKECLHVRGDNKEQVEAFGKSYKYTYHPKVRDMKIIDIRGQHIPPPSNHCKNHSSTLIATTETNKNERNKKG